MKSEIASRADFSQIRYAQCWEDADVLVEALDVGPGKVVVSIASAGDNSFALLARGAERVTALDLNPAQLACVELRAAAYRELAHPELLELIGSVAAPALRRRTHYQRCRPLLEEKARAFWDARRADVEGGIGGAGKFERYFASFRDWVLPLVHDRRTVDALLRPRTLEEREAFYRTTWDGWRWRTLFRIFFSRFVMGRLGRDPSFFRYVRGSVGDRILERTRHALVALDPSQNPYLQWILYGRHPAALPFALREENFQAIRANLDRLEWRQSSLEEYLEEVGPAAVDAFNLSDVFEYGSDENYRLILEKLVRASRPGARLAYWNMLAPRSRPDDFADRLKPLSELAARLHRADKAFFYSRFVVEEVVRPC